MKDLLWTLLALPFWLVAAPVLIAAAALLVGATTFAGIGLMLAMLPAYLRDSVKVAETLRDLTKVVESPVVKTGKETIQ